MLCNHVHSVVPEHFHYPKGSPESPVTPAPPCPQTLATTHLLPVSMDLPVQGLSYEWNKITRCVFFGVRHVCISTSFLLTAERCSIAWICHFASPSRRSGRLGGCHSQNDLSEDVVVFSVRTAPDHTCDQIQAWPLLASLPPGPPWSLLPPSGQHRPLGSCLCTPEAPSAPLCLLGLHSSPDIPLLRFLLKCMSPPTMY